MKLDRETWKTLKFGDFAHNISERVEPKETKLKIYIGLEHIDSGQLRIERFGNPDEVIGTKLKFYKGDIIFGKRRAYQKKAGIAEIDGICSAHSMVLRAKEEKVIKQFFPYFIHSDVFMNKAIEISEGSLSPTIKWKTLEKQEFLLPPIDEQKNILAFFQTLETIIEQAEGQEKNLRALAKHLIDGLINDKPTFGNLLEGKELTKVKFADVAIKMNRRFDPSNADIERIIAGENLESEDFKIRSWGIIGRDFLGPAFHMLFQKGDILYGSRRTYLRKVALADFDGVCANTTFVIRAKEEILLQDLLKHIMLSEPFTQYSIGVSKGSTNPYINWKDLDNFTFQIPDIETQREIVSILDEILEIAEQTRKQKQTLKNLKFKLLNEILG